MTLIFDFDLDFRTHQSAENEVSMLRLSKVKPEHYRQTYA